MVVILLLNLFELFLIKNVIVLVDEFVYKGDNEIIRVFCLSDVNGVLLFSLFV